MRLNNQRIEALVEQLYDINRRLMALEGKLVRLADNYGVNEVTYTATDDAGLTTACITELTVVDLVITSYSIHYTKLYERPLAQE